MNDLDPDDVVKLAKLEFEALHPDFRSVPGRQRIRRPESPPPEEPVSRDPWLPWAFCLPAKSSKS